MERNANSVPTGVYDHELSGKAKGQDGCNGASANANQYLATGVREADEVCLGHIYALWTFMWSKATEKQVLSREGYGLISNFLKTKSSQYMEN